MAIPINPFPTNPNREYYNEHPEQYSSVGSHKKVSTVNSENPDGEGNVDDLIVRILKGEQITLSDSEQLMLEEWLGLTHNYMSLTNETPYTPSTPYNPATKKYVDEHGVQISENPQGGYDLVDGDGEVSTVAKQNNLAKVDSQVNKLEEHFSEFVEVPYSQDSYRMYLTTTGNYGTYGIYRTRWFPVTAGETIYVHSTLGASHEARNFQFQTAKDVPYSGENPYIVGTPSDDPFTGMLTVPDGANWLIMTMGEYASDGIKANSLKNYSEEIKPQNNTLPTASEDKHGAFAIINNNGNDELYCNLKVNNAYTWVKIHPTT